MSITSITIENFKGIAAPVSIPIRPITLLFGQNSSGKSTILQALHYLRELLEYRRPDPDRTQVGGDTIDLGGFHALVYRHDLDRRIRIQVAFSLDDDGLPNNGITSLGDIDRSLTSQKDSSWLDLNSQVKLDSAWIEVITAWETGKGAKITEYAVGLNGEELVRLHQPYAFRPELLSVNPDHTIAKQLDNSYFLKSSGFQQLCEQICSPYEDHEQQGVPKIFSTPFPLNAQDSLIPDPDKPFLIDEDFTDSPDDRDIYLFWSVIGRALTGPLAILLQELRGIRYLGPTRDVPPRNYRSPKTPIESRWACGLGGWDALVRDPSLVEKTSVYLHEVLNLGYSMRHEERISIDVNGDAMSALRLLAAQYDERDASYLIHKVLDPLEQLPRQSVIQLHDEMNNIDVSPPDIGVGVSQVIPVVVGALDTGSPDSPSRIFAAEQPELHIHPAVQVALGDLFIDAVRGTERTMLIETHSEHLLLRLLRRVREQTENLQESAAPKFTPNILSIVYVKLGDDGVDITPLPITEEGEFTRQWPDGFFEERAEELF